MFLNLIICLHLIQNKLGMEKFATYLLHLIPDNVFDESIFSSVHAFTLYLLHGF